MMNHTIRAMRRPSWARPQPVRTAAAILASAVVTLLAAACSGGGQSSAGAAAGSGGAPGTGGSAHSKLVAFSHCMRSHGVPTWPDPSSSQTNIKFGPGPLEAQQYRVSSAQFNAARSACQHLLPVGANDTFPSAMMPQILRGMRTFSRCVRSHGVPNWPDPSTNSQGQPGFNLVPTGINADSPEAKIALNECQHLLPPQLHGGVPVER